jgi:tetratricopeptide (TPR) repeat protein
MRTNLDPKLQQLEMELFDEARAAYLKLRGDCARAGIKSAHVAWGLAVTCDGLGEFETAMGHIREALEIDPLAIPYQRSFDVIVERLRKTLGDDTRDPGDPSTPRLYQMLVQAGEGDVNSHLAMARYHHHTGDNRAALKLLDAVTTLAPACRQAWAYKAVVARSAGDFQSASEAEIEAAALEGHERVPFTMFTQARG